MADAGQVTAVKKTSIMPFPFDEKLSYILVLCSLVIPTETIPKQQIFANSERANFRSEYRNKLSVNANFRSKFRNELSVKANFRSKFRNELSVKANFRSKIRVNYNNRHCENSANFLRTFALDKNSPFFVEKPRNSRISSNYVLITFSQYCTMLSLHVVP